MQNLRGIIFITLAMAGFALEDVFIKSMTQGMPTSQTLFLLGVGGSIAFAIIIYLQSGSLSPLFHPDMRSPMVLWRNLSEGVSAMFFVSALALVPLSTVVAVFQAMPLATTAGAAIFLGEAVGWRRWSAIGVGFLGVMIILRPGGVDFQLAALLPIAAVFGIAARDLITRQLKPSIPSTSVAFYAFAICIFAGLLLIPISGGFVMPDAKGWLYMLGATTFGVSGYYFIVVGMRIAETSIIMPFRYTRLIFSIALGMLVFGERPDTLTFVGAAIVISTGIYMVWREHSIRKAARVR